LSAPVDVYYDWVDACYAVAKEARPDKEAISPRLLRGGGGPGDDAHIAAATGRADKYDDEDGFVVADEGEDDFVDED
jgi:transcription elongation factor Elf1